MSITLDELRQQSLAIRDARLKELRERMEAIKHKVDSLSQAINEEAKLIKPNFNSRIILKIIYADYSMFMRSAYLSFNNVSIDFMKQILDNLKVNYDGYIGLDESEGCNANCFTYVFD